MVSMRVLFTFPEISVNTVPVAVLFLSSYFWSYPFFPDFLPYAFCFCIFTFQTFVLTDWVTIILSRSLSLFLYPIPVSVPLSSSKLSIPVSSSPSRKGLGWIRLSPYWSILPGNPQANPESNHSWYVPLSSFPLCACCRNLERRVLSCGLTVLGTSSLSVHWTGSRDTSNFEGRGSCICFLF